MRSSAFLLSLAGIALASPRPQDIDINGVESASAPVIITPAFATLSQTASVVPISSQAATAAAAISTDPASINSPTSTSSTSTFIPMAPSSVMMAQNPASLIASASASPSAKKRSNLAEKRDGTCAPQPPGSGPVADPDTPAAFAANPALSVGQPS